jgi:RHS repeat-associated protein
VQILDDKAYGKTVTYNLRFPGQYSLSESGLHYNYFRIYDPQMGRYLQSDPIALGGGNYSTYAYAKDNPLSNGDPFGLFSLGFNVTEIPTFFVTNGDDGHTTSSVTHYQCTCMRVSCQWKLQECSGVLQVNVEIQRLLWPLNKQIARAYEEQHVNDYRAARSAMEADLTQREKVLKSNLYQDEQSCADSAKAALEPFILQWQINIAKLSYDKYDYPGGPHIEITHDRSVNAKCRAMAGHS